MTALASEALRLPLAERLKLIEEIWASLATEPSKLPVSQAELDELDQRRSRYKAEPGSLVDWEDLKRRIKLKG